MNQNNYVNSELMQFDVLILQQQHHSQGIWNNKLREDETLLRVRRQDNILWQHLKNNPLHPHIFNLFNYIDFKGILEVGNIHCEYGLVTTLVERWH